MGPHVGFERAGSSVGFVADFASVDAVVGLAVVVVVVVHAG